MNEAVRIPKLAYADRINKARSENINNMLLYSLILLPLCYLSRRFYVHRGGLPVTNSYHYFYMKVPTILINTEPIDKWRWKPSPGTLSSYLALDRCSSPTTPPTLIRSRIGTTPTSLNHPRWCESNNTNLYLWSSIIPSDKGSSPNPSNLSSLRLASTRTLFEPPSSWCLCSHPWSVCKKLQWSLHWGSLSELSTCVHC